LKKIKKIDKQDGQQVPKLQRTHTNKKSYVQRQMFNPENEEEMYKVLKIN